MKPATFGRLGAGPTPRARLHIAVVIEALLWMKCPSNGARRAPAHARSQALLWPC